MATQELCWLTYLLTDFGDQHRSPSVLYVDNKAMIALCQEHRLEHKTKHISLRYFLARELQQHGQLRLAYMATRANTADIFTKALPPAFFALLLLLNGLVTIACSCYPPLRLWGTDRTLQKPEDFPNAHRGGLHLGVEKHYNSWKIFDVHSKETLAARDALFYEQLTLQTYLDNLVANRDLTGGFRGKRAFTSAADKADWDEPNVDIPMDDDNPRESVNAEAYFDFADNGYVTPQTVDTNVSERIGPNFLPDLEVGDKSAYPEDTNLPCNTQSGLQILGLVTPVHRAAPPKELATIQQALGGNKGKSGAKPWTKN
ncbi:unnamed protein product [Closterium sp. NIES-53]